MAQFLASVSRDIPARHAFHKDYKLTDAPNTAAKQLIRAAEIAPRRACALFMSATRPATSPLGEYLLPSCREKLIDRFGYWCANTTDADANARAAARPFLAFGRPPARRK